MSRATCIYQTALSAGEAKNVEAETVLFIYFKQTEGPEKATNTVLKYKITFKSHESCYLKSISSSLFFKTATVGEQSTELGRRFHTFTILLVR